MASSGSSLACSSQYAANSAANGAEAAGLAATVVMVALVLAGCVWAVVGAKVASQKLAATVDSSVVFISNDKCF